MEQAVIAVIPTLLRVVLGAVGVATLVLAALGVYALVAMVRAIRGWPF